MPPGPTLSPRAGRSRVVPHLAQGRVGAGWSLSYEAVSERPHSSQAVGSWPWRPWRPRGRPGPS
eukprot:3155141-Heterocapsa_arctica.AAC.1